jgi:hypothetical protein
MITKSSLSFDSFAKNAKKIVVLATAASLLSACGSGTNENTSPGGNATVNPPVTPPEVFDGVSLGGQVSGYAGGDLVLKTETGGEVKISNNGNFIFSSQIKRGEAYKVFIGTQPVAQTCQLINGQGFATKDITDIQISCETDAFYKASANYTQPQSLLIDGYQLSFYDAFDCVAFLPKLNEVNRGSAMYVPSFTEDLTTSTCATAAVAQKMQMNWRFWFTAKDGVNSVNFGHKDKTTGQETMLHVPASETAVQDQVEDRIEKVENNTALMPQIATWYITPELLRPWRHGINGTYTTIDQGNEMRFLEVATNKIRNVEQDKNWSPKPIVVYQPSYRAQSDFEIIGKYVNIVVGGVSTKDPQDATRAIKIFTDVKELSNGTLSLQNKPLPIASLEVSADPGAGLAEKDLKKALTQNVYLTAVGGARGVWIDMDNTAVSLTNKIKLSAMYLEVFKTINVDEPDLGRALAKGQMDRADNLVPTITAGNSADLYYQNYFFDGKRYVVAINGSSTDALSGALTGWPTNSVLKELNPNVETNFRSLNKDSTLQFQIEPNGVRVWRVSIE